MKTVALGDTHGRINWKRVIRKEKPDRVIFIGDYFDSFDIPAIDQIRNFEDIVKYKKEADVEVFLLIGNHDHHYFPEVGYTGTSGYQSGAKYNLESIVNEHREHLQICYAMDEFLFTHAGVGGAFLDKVYGKEGWKIEEIPQLLQELWKKDPRYFIFSGRDGYGDDMGQTPIWIRPRSLMRDGLDIKKTWIQVVGHTHQPSIDIKGKSTGGRYYFIDTMAHGEYLIIEDGKVKSGKL